MGMGTRSNPDFSPGKSLGQTDKFSHGGAMSYMTQGEGNCFYLYHEALNVFQMVGRRTSLGDQIEAGSPYI